jgi:hypothetical protein
MSTPRSAQLAITSDYGRIGPFWWINSDQQIREMRGPIYFAKLIKWGTFGLGPDAVVSYLVIDHHLS